MRQNLLTKITDYFFKPISPYPLGLFRVLFGLCVSVTLLLLHADWLAWFGVRGWVSMETIGKAESGVRLDLFGIVPHDDRWIAGFYWLLLVASLTLAVGLGTRLSSVIVYLGLNSLNQRNPLILHGGDTFLRAAGFFLMVAPAGAALSIDSVLTNRRHRTPHRRVRQISPWAQRLIQYQLTMIYLAGFWWKAKGTAWWNGTALFYVVNLREVRRFPLPSLFHEVWIQHLGTWLVMCFELLFPLLVWRKRFRNPLLLAGLLFHLSLEYALNVPMFQWDMLCAYPLFFEDDELLRRFSKHVSEWFELCGRTLLRTGRIAIGAFVVRCQTFFVCRLTQREQASECSEPSQSSGA